MDVLGSPSEEDISFVTDEKAREYLRLYPKREKMDLKTSLPGSSDQALDLLYKMLAFNPFLRPTADECLRHPFFDSVRDAQADLVSEEEICFDFDAVADDDILPSQLRRLFLEEVDYYKTKKQ